MVFAIILLSRRFIIVQDNWVENPDISEKTKIFYSPDQNENPNFDLEVKFLFNGRVPNVYEGYIWQHFGKNSTFRV